MYGGDEQCFDFGEVVISLSVHHLSNSSRSALLRFTKTEREALVAVYVNVSVVQIVEPRHNKTNKVTVRPAKTQISLGIRPVWSESSLCAEWVAKDPNFLRADSEDSDQTGRMPRLIWVFAERTVTLFAECTVTLLVLSYRGSNYLQLCLSVSLSAISSHLLFHNSACW